MIKQIIINTSQMAGAVAAKAVTSLILNKLIAIFYGPTGITLFAHLQNLLTLVVHLPNDGVNRGSIALFQSSNKYEKAQIIKKILLYNFLLTSFFLLIILIGHNYFWQKFTPFTEGIMLPLIFALTVVFIVFYYTFITAFQADRKYFKFALISSLSSIIILISGAFTVFYFDVITFLLVYLIAQAVSFIVVLLYFLHDYTFISQSKKIHIIKPLFDFVLMAVSIWLFTYLFDFIVRNYAIDTFGYEATGQWQAAVKLSDQLKAVFIATSGAVFFTEISARIEKVKDLKKYLLKTLSSILPIVFCSLLLIYLARKPIINILYSSDFIESEKFFHFQFAGDFLAMASFFFIYIIMARRKVLNFILLQTFSGVTYIILVFYLSEAFDLQGIVMAHFFRYIFFLILAVYYSRKAMNLV